VIQERKNKWTIIEKFKNDKCLAQCDCGEISKNWISNIQSGKSKQCYKCQANDQKIKTNLKTHGYSKEKLYAKWVSMKSRCNNKNAKSYKNYGAVGVKVCDKWNDNYLEFRKWAMSNGYEHDLEISRKKDIGNYEPLNCKFITKKENMTEAFKNKHYTCARRIKMSKNMSHLTESEYNDLMDKASSGEYRASELSNEYKVDRHNIINMLMLHGRKTNYRKLMLKNHEILLIEEDESNISLGALANKYNVSRETIRQIKKGTYRK